MCGVTEAKSLNTDALTLMNIHSCGPEMQQPWRSSSGLWESHPWLCALMLLSQSLSGSDLTTAARWLSKALKKRMKDCICFAAFPSHFRGPDTIDKTAADTRFTNLLRKCFRRLKASLKKIPSQLIELQQNLVGLARCPTETQTVFTQWPFSSDVTF